MSKHIILRVLEEAERKYRMKVLYCYLGGSIKMGFNDDKSDWDVFFVFAGEQDDIRIDSKYNNYTITISGWNINKVNSGDPDHIDGFKVDEECIVIDNPELRNNYVDNIHLIDLTEYKQELRKRIRFWTARLRGTGNGRFNKKNYIHAYIEYMRLLWVRKYNNIDYPLKIRVLLREFRNRAWHDTLLQMIRTRRRHLKSRNTQLFNILKNELDK